MDDKCFYMNKLSQMIKYNEFTNPCFTNIVLIKETEEKKMNSIITSMNCMECCQMLNYRTKKWHRCIASVCML